MRPVSWEARRRNWRSGVLGAWTERGDLMAVVAGSVQALNREETMRPKVRRTVLVLSSRVYLPACSIVVVAAVLGAFAVHAVLGLDDHADVARFLIFSILFRIGLLVEVFGKRGGQEGDVLAIGRPCEATGTFREVGKLARFASIHRK